MVARQIVGSVSAYQEVLGGKKEVGKTHCILDFFFGKRLSLESDQPSTSSGETMRLHVPSVSSKYDDLLKFCRQCTALINRILIKLTFIGYIYILKRYVHNPEIRYSGCRFVRTQNASSVLYIAVFQYENQAGIMRGRQKCIRSIKCVRTVIGSDGSTLGNVYGDSASQDPCDLLP